MHCWCLKALVDINKKLCHAVSCQVGANTAMRKTLTPKQVDFLRKNYTKTTHFSVYYYFHVSKGL